MLNQDAERPTLGRALDAIGKETGGVARLLEWEPQLPWHTPVRPDALVEIQTPEHAEKFAAAIKNVDRFETLNQMRALWPRKAKPPLLIVAPYLTPQLAERCREIELYFADTAGNVYLRGPGLHLYVTGRRRPPNLAMAEAGRTTNPTALRVIFALLCNPGLLHATYREIAAAARVALGTIRPVMKYLEIRKHITPAAEGARAPRRKFLDARRLVEEWVALYPAVLRPKLNIRRFEAQNPDWMNEINLQPYHAYWGGEVAANRMLHLLVPGVATIYDKQNTKQHIAEHKLRADVKGDVEILDVFWNLPLPTPGDLVPPILTYADLIATNDGRNLEAARMIYEQYIEPALRNLAWPDRSGGSRSDSKN
jgi:hypothetical protein